MPAYLSAPARNRVRNELQSIVGTSLRSSFSFATSAVRSSVSFVARSAARVFLYASVAETFRIAAE